MSKTRRTFLRTCAITAAGLAVLPKTLFGKPGREKLFTPDAKSLESEVFDLKLSRDPYYGFRLENDVVGVSLWGTVTQPTFNIGKADIWDRRWFFDRQPLITLDKIKELAMSDRLSEICPTNDLTVYDLYNKYDFPSPKTGGQLILGVPFATQTRFKTRENGSIRMSITGQNKSLMVDIWVTLEYPVVVMEFSGVNLEKGDFWVRTYRHQDTIKPGEQVNPSYGEAIMPDDFEQMPVPNAYAIDNCWGIKQNFIPDYTFPGGFEYSLFSTCIEQDPETELKNNELNLGTPLWTEKEGQIITTHEYKVLRYTPINQASGSAVTASFNSVNNKFTILTAIQTTQDGDDTIASTVDTLNSVKKLGILGLHYKQTESLQKYRRRELAQASVGDIQISAPQFTLPNLRKSGGYYGDIPLCFVDSTKFCFQDSSIWHADFHFNEILPHQLLTLGQFEQILLYCEMIHTLLPGAQENALNTFNLPGAMYTLAHFPLKTNGLAHTCLTWEMDIGLNGAITKPVWLYYKYTGDIDYLKNLAYPVLSECARFCKAYLTEGEDGYLHIIPTVSPEHWGLTANFVRNKDCTSALTATRYLFRASAEAAGILGVDESEALEWGKSAERLADFPTYMTANGPIWVDVAGAPPIQYNTPVPLAPVFWGDEVGLDSPIETISIAKRTLENMLKGVENPRIQDYFIPPRLGIWIRSQSLNSENLLQSYQSIHIFPAVPPTGEIIMENFAAEGGFRVSAKRTSKGKIYDVRIKSNLGGTCRLYNPWKGVIVSIRKDKSEVPYDEDDKGILTFQTNKSATYSLSELTTISEVGMIYPNPSDGRINLVFDPNEGKVHVDVINLTGQIIFTNILSAQANSIYPINLKALPKGIYFLTAQNNLHKETRKIIIQ